MRTIHTARIPAWLLAIAVVAGGSTSQTLASPTRMPSTLGTRATHVVAARMQASGRAAMPHSALHMPSLATSRFVRPQKAFKGLFVADDATPAVEMFANGTYQGIGSITSGLVGPDGDWLDAKRNLYVADYLADDIVEYGRGATSPTFVYNAGMIDPVDVTTDRDGNVYEADFDYPTVYNGWVNEYAQGSNAVVNSCAPGGGVTSVAVDKNDDVFVAYLTQTGPDISRIVEYKGGLAGCNGTVLGVTFGFTGSITLDKRGNLIVCDQDATTVDIMAPPYNAVTGTLGSGFYQPFHLTLSKNNKLAFLVAVTPSDFFGYVAVMDYPSGNPVTTLGTAQGVGDASGAVDTSNAVY